MQFDYEFRSRRSNVMSTQGMVASSHPQASLAGLDILRLGGTAADAAVATAAVLNVVEPIATGIGGDCFVLYWDASQKKVFALNASGPAAATASIDELRKAGYEKYPLYSGHAVSVPGTVAGWSALIEKFGNLTFPDILAPAIRLAEVGFPVSEWVASGWKLMVKRILRNEVDLTLPKYKQLNGPPQKSAKEFLIDSRAPNVGELIKLPTLGETLRGIAAHGESYVYEGQFAEKLCEHVQRYEGWLTVDDLKGFKAEWVEPIHADFHGVRLYECPPNGQGLAAIIAAKIADGFDLAGMNVVDRTHILIECMRIGFTEALQWVADPKLVDIPYLKLFSESYIRSRRALIQKDHAINHIQSYIPNNGDNTTYLSVVDGKGNACSFISSLYTGVGTGLIVPGTGVFLQNRAALFSLDPGHPNSLKGGKRPYHTIIPAMLTKNNELYASFGIMGGYMQPQAHLQVMSNLIDLNHNPQQALDMPRFSLNIGAGGGVGAMDPGGEVLMESGYSFEELASLRRKGHRVSPVSGWQRIIFGGGQIIQRDSKTGVLIAGSDPRKDGCAIGW